MRERQERERRGIAELGFGPSLSLERGHKSTSNPTRYTQKALHELTTNTRARKDEPNPSLSFTLTPSPPPSIHLPPLPLGRRSAHLLLPARLTLQHAGRSVPRLETGKVAREGVEVGLAARGGRPDRGGGGGGGGLVLLVGKRVSTCAEGQRRRSRATYASQSGLAEQTGRRFEEVEHVGFEEGERVLGVQREEM